MSNPSRSKESALRAMNDKTTTAMVFRACKELEAMGMSANRYSIREFTGLVQTIVDDRLKVLKDDGELFRTAKGNYEVIKRWPAPRAISKTEVDGWVIYEAGDQVMRLTPEENRQMAKMCAGEAAHVLTLDSTREHLMLAHDLAGKVNYLMQQIKALREKQDQRQGLLTLEEVN